MMPWNWMVWRVVSRSVPLPRSRATRLRRQPLLRRQHAARHAQPRHEDERLLHLLAPAFGAQVAVVLHVDAVELGQLLVVVRQRAGFDAGQAIGDGAAQEAAVRLDRFVGRRWASHERHRLTSPACMERSAQRRRADVAGQSRLQMHPRPGVADVARSSQ